MKKYFIFLFFIISLASVNHAKAAEPAEYKLLAPVPYVVKKGTGSTTDAKVYIPGLIKLTIALAGGMAVVMIVYGGIQYIVVESISGKGNARETIQNAFWGLALALSAWIILNTIDKRLVNFNFEIKGQEYGSKIDTDLPDLMLEETVNPSARYDTTGCDCDYADDYSFPKKTVAEAGCAAPGPCLVDHELAGKLEKLSSFLNNKWKVTEMFPPSRDHAHPCHKPGSSVPGKCVDAALRGLSCLDSKRCNFTLQKADADRVKEFITRAESRNIGLKVIYEVPNKDRYNMLVNNGVPRKSIRLIENKPIYEHFSVYLNESVYSAIR